jgi:hypothetical protein
LLYIVLCITGIAAILLVRSSWSTRRQLLIAAGVFALALAVYVGVEIMRVPPGVDKGRGEQLLEEITWFEGLLYAVMLMGMASKVMLDAMNRKRGVKFNKHGFLKPLLVSPIVFGAVYGAAGDEASSILLLLLSYQNGYFWQSVLNKNAPE